LPRWLRQRCVPERFAGNLPKPSAELQEQPNSRMADFRAVGSQESYLVEVTERSPEIEYRNFLEELGEKHGATLTRTMDRSKRLDDKLADKADQLSKTPRDADFKTLWITAFHADAKFLCEALQRTLYGIADLFGVRRPNDLDAFPPTSLACMYYDDAAFNDHRDLDGVVFVGDDIICMFVNPNCSRLTAFKSSQLCKEFAKKSALFDPLDLPDSPNLLFLDRDLDRSAPNASWAAVLDKYGWYTARANDSCFEGKVLISANAVKNALEQDEASILPGSD
jgi:hypothetical protein